MGDGRFPRAAAPSALSLQRPGRRFKARCSIVSCPRPSPRPTDSCPGPRPPARKPCFSFPRRILSEGLPPVSALQSARPGAALSRPKKIPARNSPAGISSCFFGRRTSDGAWRPKDFFKGLFQKRAQAAAASLLLCRAFRMSRNTTRSAPLTSRQIQGLELTKPATR